MINNAEDQAWKEISQIRELLARGYEVPPAFQGAPRRQLLPLREQRGHRYQAIAVEDTAGLAVSLHDQVHHARVREPWGGSPRQRDNEIGASHGEAPLRAPWRDPGAG